MFNTIQRCVVTHTDYRLYKLKKLYTHTETIKRWMTETKPYGCNRLSLCTV